MNKIKKARMAMGLKAKDLANRVSLTPASISKIESGKGGVSPVVAKRLAEVLGLSIEQVLFPEEKAA